MNKVIIVGAGGHSRAVISVLKKNLKFKIHCIIDLEYKKINEKILGVPVLGSLEILKKYSNTTYRIFNAIGNNKLREEINLSPIIKSFLPINVIDPSAYIDPTSIIGNSNFIGPFVNIGPNVMIGDSNIINTNANVEHESHVGSYNQFGPGSVICGRCQIGNNVFIGANSTIIENIKINNSNIIGAGSVVISNILGTGKTYVGVVSKPK